MAVKSLGLATAGLRSEFFKRFEAAPSNWAKLCTVIPSTKKVEQHKWLGSVPTVRKWGTGRVAKGLRSEAYNVEDEKYEATIEVDRDELDDDQTGQIRIRIAELARRAATHKDSECGGLLANGHSAGYLAYDGKCYFAADHESGLSGAQSNLLTYDISTKLPNEPNTPDDPSAVTLREVLGYAAATMGLFKDDRGEYDYIQPTGLVVCCNPLMKGKWKTALRAQELGASSNVLPVDTPPEVIGLPWLTDVSKHYFLKVDGHVKPLIVQDRGPFEFKSLAEGSDEEFMREKYYYGVRDRYKVAYGYWQYAISVDLV
jgi:phage major head subunit gpT-like protein